MSNNEKCEYCKYCHMLKTFQEGMWGYQDVCTYRPETQPEMGYGAYALIVNKDNSCENFARREA